MKSFDQTFSKVCGVLGQSPESRPQARNILNGISIREANYWFIFFAPAVSKKRTETIFSHKIPRVNRVAEDVAPYEGGSKKNENGFLNAMPQRL
jgi:hypothetical protein